jgi:hypothetical protein
MPVILKHEGGSIFMVEKRTYQRNGGFLFKMIVVDKENNIVTLESGGCGWGLIDPRTGAGTGMDWVKVIAKGVVDKATVKRIMMIETPTEFDAVYSLLYERFKSIK